MVIAEHKALAQRGAELVELRLDWLSRSAELKRLLENRPTPVVVTCRRRQDRGRWNGTEEQRRALLRAAIIEGAEYVDLEDDIAAEIRRYGETRRIVSHHNFDKTPEDLKEIHSNMTELDPDLIKLVTMAHSPGDSLRMLKLVEESEIPTLGFCMGEYGTLSRLLCGRYGAPFTYASFSNERELAPGQIAFEDMHNIYHYDQIDKNSELFAVLGDPVAHSYSPLIHNAALQHEGRHAAYLPIRVPKDNFQDSLKELEWVGLSGYSVTIPHKEAALQMADITDDATQEIGAANTLYRDTMNRWHATNTDYEAAHAALRIGLKHDDGTETSLEGRKVLVLGAGGVARAIGLGLVRAGSAVVIASRTHKRAMALAEELGCQQTQWENRGSVEPEILVNCTPVGMYPESDVTPYEQHWLNENMLIFDTIYNPENTLLIKHAKDRGCRTVSGIEMFIRQAAAQYELFTGQSAPLDVMREALRRGISPVTINVKRPSQ